MDIGSAEILGMRAVIAYISIFVIFLSFSIVINRAIRKKFNETFWFALGIGLHWVGTFQSQFGILGILPSVFYYTGLSFVIVAGIVKVRALTLGYNKTLWMIVALSSIVFGSIIFFSAKDFPWSIPHYSSTSLKN